MIKDGLAVKVKDTTKEFKETIVDVVVIMTKHKVKRIMNSNVVHNTMGNIFGESAKRTGRVTPTREYMVVVVNIVVVLTAVVA